MPLNNFMGTTIVMLALGGYTGMSYAQSERTLHNKTRESTMERLTDMQKYVTRHDGTEPAFKNEYWDNKEPGIYVDVLSGEPLFSSNDKYDSGTGWPSFTKPIKDKALKEKGDKKLIIPRTEVRSAKSDTHLGHVFDDGPKEEGGLRYCINSASLRFIHKDNLKKEGYEQYIKLFE